SQQMAKLSGIISPVKSLRCFPSPSQSLANEAGQEDEENGKGKANSIPDTVPSLSQSNQYITEDTPVPKHCYQPDSRSMRHARLLALSAKARSRSAGNGGSTRPFPSSRSASSKDGFDGDESDRKDSDDSDENEHGHDDSLAGFIVGDADEDILYHEESLLSAIVSRWSCAPSSEEEEEAAAAAAAAAKKKKAQSPTRQRQQQRQQQRRRRLFRGRRPQEHSISPLLPTNPPYARTGLPAVPSAVKHGMAETERLKRPTRDDLHYSRMVVPQSARRGVEEVSSDSCDSSSSSSNKALSYPTPLESSAGTSDHELSSDEAGNQRSTPTQIHQSPYNGSSKMKSLSLKQTQVIKGLKADSSKVERDKVPPHATRPLDRLLELHDLEAHFWSDLNDGSDGGAGGGDDDLFKFAQSKITPAIKTVSDNAQPSNNPASKSKRAQQAELRIAKKEKQARKKAFDESKDDLAKKFLQTLDGLITHGQIHNLAASDGGVKIIWSRTLNKTAGRANWKRIVSRGSSSGSSARASSSTTPEPVSENNKHSHPDDSTEPDPTSGTVRHIASIELAEKIIDCEDRLYKTLAHEFCHLANFMISHVVDNPHGESFRRWASKCTAALRNHPHYSSFDVTVTTRHSYQIDYKYVWSCSGCGLEYGRHSKSIDPTKVRCGKCKTGVLVQVKPKPRSVSPKKKNNTNHNVKSIVSEKGRDGCAAETRSGTGSGSAIGSITDKLKVIVLDD
ncbi:hypothetical protein KEM54_001912, partial [Ascosphaera aggregata]